MKRSGLAVKITDFGSLSLSAIMRLMVAETLISDSNTRTLESELDQHQKAMTLAIAMAEAYLRASLS